MGDRRSPVYDTYGIPYPPGQLSSLVSQQSSLYPPSGQYLPSQGGPHNPIGGGVPYQSGYNVPAMAPYASAPITTVAQQMTYPPNQPIPPNQPHRSHSHLYSHSQSQTQQYAPSSSRPQSHTRFQSLVHDCSPAPPSQEHYLSSFVQTVNTTPQYPASPSRPFACDKCALSFSRAHDLRRHRETHTGEKPFPCNGGCGKTFSRKDAMRRHQLVKQCGIIEEAWP